MFALPALSPSNPIQSMDTYLFLESHIDTVELDILFAEKAKTRKFQERRVVLAESGYFSLLEGERGSGRVGCLRGGTLWKGEGTGRG